MIVEKNILKNAIVVGAELDIRISIAAQLTKNTPTSNTRAPMPGDNEETLSLNSIFCL